jgi:hypothetical protein
MHATGSTITLRRKFPVRPARPERNCWGCDRYCAADAMLCGNGSERAQHPIELFGDDWLADAEDERFAPAA